LEDSSTEEQIIGEGASITMINKWSSDSVHDAFLFVGQGAFISYMLIYLIGQHEADNFVVGGETSDGSVVF